MPWTWQSLHGEQNGTLVPTLNTRMLQLTNELNRLDSYERGEHVFNVKHPRFGAKGHGLAPDYSAIMRAIDAAAAFAGNGTAETGGYVMVPPGSYELSDTVEVPTRVTVGGYGRMVTHIFAGSSFPTDTPLFHIGTTGSGFGSLLEEMTIDCNNVDGSVGVYATTLEEFSGIRRCHIRKAQQYGVHFDSRSSVCQQFCLDRLEISLSKDSDSTSVGLFLQLHNNGRPAYVRDLSLSRVGDSGLETGAGTCMRLDGVSATTIQGVHMERCTTDGILIGEASPCLSLHLTGMEGNPASSLTRLIRISDAIGTKSRGIIITGFRANASMDLLVDDINGVTITDSDFAYWMQGTPGSVNEDVWPELPSKLSTPSALSAGDNNDYALASPLTDSVRLQANGSGSRLTGIASGVRRRKLRVVNISSNPLTLGHEVAASTAANRIVSPTGQDIVLAANGAADLEYDGGATARWRVVGIATRDSTSAAEPTTSGRTWLVAERIYKTTPTAGDWIGWVVTAAGTTGTLAGVTGDITSGTDDLVVSSATSLRVGQYITIAGVTGTKRITAISGTAVTIDSNADATIDDAAIAWSAPTFKEWGAIDT